MSAARRRLLLLWEGDFSFALAWARFQSRFDPGAASGLVATSLDSRADVERRYKHAGLRNAEALRELGASVMHGVDATELPGNLGLGGPFDQVRFNFPHARDRWRTQDNQQLLRGFFCAVRSVLREGPGEGGGDAAEVLVTLVAGQGGTAADGAALRVPADSWRITEQAAHSGFKLVSATPFDHRRWHRRGYMSRGHRRSSVGAATLAAVEHRFVAAGSSTEGATPYFGKKAIW